jgi:hypothetical protein
MRVQSWKSIPFLAVSFLFFTAIETRAAAPTITSLSPTSGAVGASVTITGTNFGSSQGSSTVKFNGTSATAASWSATSIVAAVPTGATTGNVVVTVSGTASNGKSFTVVSAPSITSLSPTTGAVGASVTITGTNFGSSQGSGTVKFNGTTATVTSWSATSIATTVPSGATTGNVVVFASGVNSSGKSFTVVSAPSITSLSPTTGAVGAAVTITGTNFGSSQGSSTVKFNGTTATVTTWSATSIVTTVPSGATTGNVVVFASGVNSNGSSFTVVSAPSITSLSKTSGAVGTSITITGTNFGSSQGSSTVKFNGTTATVTTWSATSIATTVPSGATTGNVVVFASGVNSNGSSFTVVPNITSLSPTTGAVGASVTITGTTFGSTQGTSTVKFNGTTGTPTNWSATSIVVPVPSGATTGNVVVTVSSQASNGISFTVVSAPSITSLSPTTGAVGASVTITGTNFGSSQGSSTVKFNGTAGTVTSWSATSIATTVPSGATTGNVVVFASGVNSNGSSFTVVSAPSITSLSPTSGAVGTPVTITGTNFGSSQGSSTVKFNGTTATVTTWSATSIATTVPSGATTGNVVVFASGVNSNGSSFTVVSGPSITSLSPTSGGAGAAVTITGTNFGSSQGSSTVKFNGTTSTVTSWSATSIGTMVPSGATTGNIVVTVGGVPSNGSSFTVAALASLSVTPQNSTILAGNTQQFTATGTYSDNSTQNLTATATWTSSASAAATINSSALATAVGPGQTTIQASVGSIQGSALLTVSGFALTGSLNTARNDQTATLLNNGTVLVVGGDDINGNALASAELYNPATGSFTTTGSLNTARINDTATLLDDGTVLFAGGSDSNGNLLSSAEIYNPATGVFTVATGSLVTPRANHTATLLGNGMVLLVGSADSSGNVSGSAEIYNAATQSFTGTGSLNTARGLQTAALLNNGTVLILGGGANGSVLASAELYNVGSGTFTATGSLNTGRVQNTVTLLNSGSVLVAGGSDINGNALATAELYNPTTMTFTPTGSLNTARGDHAATLLNNGTVLVEGGYTSSADMTASAELYDPVAATFSPTGSLNVARQVQTATLLVNGAVLVAGGFSDSPRALSSAELYEPASFVPTNLVSISLSPLNSSIPTGTPQAFVATGTFSDNSTQTLASVTWSSSNTPVITMSNDSGNRGVALGLAVGSATISACTGTICGSTALTIVPADPIITTLTPNAGPVGASVSIVGTGFGTLEGPSTVTVDGIAAIVNTWSSTTINAVVPAGATTGNTIVFVGGVNSNLVEFTVLPTPVISNISPTIGDVGAPVEIDGSSFGGTQGSNTVTVNGAVLTITNWSATSITGTIPIGATSGNVIVTVAGVPSNPVAFTVPNVPAIFSLSPPLGPAGTVVTIAGADFGPAQGTSTVSFNGVVASVTSWSSTSVTAIVPTGATTGPVVINTAGTLSNGVVFFTPGLPNVLSLSPATAPIGWPVTITGTNFGASQGSSTVSFNGALATATSWSPTQIVTTVPSGATSGIVTVTASGVTGTASFFNVFTGVAVSSFSPASGDVGNGVNIEGSNFGATQGSSTVTFNGTLASVTSWSDQQIQVLVPNGTSTGNLVVTVYGIATNAGAFTLVPTPVISSISPASGVVGTSITISGSHFGASQGGGGVQFPDLDIGGYAPVTSWSDTTIVLPVPAGRAFSGNVFVRASEGLFQSTGPSNQVFFTVLPSINSLSPALGTVATSIQINGTGFGFDQTTGTVTFNGVVANPTSWSPTQIVTYPPVGATSGNVVVTVSGNASLGTNFTLQPGPAISSLSPTNGVAGTSITITGTGFGSPQGSSTVTFNGTSATPTAWTATSITVPVPTAATTGNVVVTVGGVASEGVNFTLDPAPAISSLSQTSGSVGTAITISGSNFLDTQSSSTVTFNGTAATPTFWSANSIGVNVPTGATTGNVVVTVLGHASAGVRFTLTSAPNISSLSPTTGPAGTLVTINGSNFGSTQGTSFLTFNGVPVTPTSWASGRITAAVPEGTTTGPVVVTVNNGPSNNSTFTVTAGPGITGISPASGGIGATVTITGAAFGSSQGSSTVKFNGTTAVPSLWSDTGIVVPVPTGATTGNIVVTVGAPSNGVSFTISSGLSVTTVSPTSGNTGNAVVITGTGFGTTQGGSTVTFNGATATVISWSNTSIVTSVPAAAISGPVVVTVGGASSDGIYFTAQPQILGISPNPAALGANVTITGENYGAAQGVSVISCGGTSQFVSSWSQSSITLQGCISAAGQIPIQITVNGVASLPAIIQGIPAPTISGVAPNTAPVGAAVLIRGANFGSTQGQSSVTIDGVAAPMLSWSNSGIVVSVPSVASGLATITVTVGGIPASLSNVLEIGTLPAPTTLQITPSGVNLLIGSTKLFNVVDNTGKARSDATWSVDNTSLATIATNASPLTGNSALLTAIAAGTVTLTATVQGMSAEMPVTISSAVSFPAGTVLWSAPPVSGFSPSQIAQALPSDFGPNAYSIQKNSSGTQTLVQAFTAGQMLWQTTVRALASNAVPDGFGGLLVTEVCDATNNLPMDIIDLDGVTGASVWTATVAQPTNGACPLGAPKLAIRQDGAVVIANPLQVSPALVILDGPSGGVLPTPTIPGSTLINAMGQPQTCDCFTPVGQPIVDSGGSIYVGYETREIPSTSAMSSVLSLLTIGIDGSTATTQLSSSTGANLFPGNIIPDGQGGALVTWTIANANPPAAAQPYEAAYVSGGAVIAAYPLPNAPTTLNTGSDGLPINPPLLLGQNAAAVASYGSNLTSFNLNLGSANWNYQAPGQDILTPVELTSDGGLTINDSVAGAVQLDPNGNVLGSAPYLQGASPFSLFTWVGLTNGVFGEILSPSGSNAIVNTLLESPWPAPEGDPQSQHQPPYCARANSHCVIAPHSDISTIDAFSGAPLREVEYDVLSLQNGVLSPIDLTTIQQVKMFVFETNPTNSATIICSQQLILGGGCQSPVPNCNPAAGSFCFSPGVYIDDYSARNTGPNTVTQQFFIDRWLVGVYWPQKASDGNVYWYGAYSQTAGVNRATIPQGALIIQVNPDLQHAASCPRGCSFTKADGTQLQP